MSAANIRSPSGRIVDVAGEAKRDLQGFRRWLNAAAHPQDGGVKSFKDHSSESEWLAGRHDGGDYGSRRGAETQVCLLQVIGACMELRQTWTRAGNSLESSGVEWLAASI